MDRSRGTASPGLTLALLSIAHAAIHAQSALMPLVYPIVVIEFGLNAADIGTFIAVTTAVGGSMQLAYGFLTRYVARPALLVGPGRVGEGADEQLAHLDVRSAHHLHEVAAAVAQVLQLSLEELAPVGSTVQLVTDSGQPDRDQEDREGVVRDVACGDGEKLHEAHPSCAS